MKYINQNPDSKIRKLSQPTVHLCPSVSLHQSDPERSLETICHDVFKNEINGVPDDAMELLSTRTMQTLIRHPATCASSFLFKTTGMSYN